MALFFCACVGRCVLFSRRENGTGLVPCGRCVRLAVKQGISGPAGRLAALNASLCLGLCRNSDELRPLNGTQLTTNGREKGQHVIIFHSKVEICIAVSCRFPLLLLSFLPPVRTPASHSNAANGDLKSSACGLFRRTCLVAFFHCDATAGRPGGREHFLVWGVSVRPSARLLITAILPRAAAAAAAVDR